MIQGANGLPTCERHCPYPSESYQPHLCCCRATCAQTLRTLDLSGVNTRFFISYDTGHLYLQHRFTGTAKVCVLGKVVFLLWCGVCVRYTLVVEAYWLQWLLLFLDHACCWSGTEDSQAWALCPAPPFFLWHWCAVASGGILPAGLGVWPGLKGPYSTSKDRPGPPREHPPLGNGLLRPALLPQPLLLPPLAGFP